MSLVRTLLKIPLLMALGIGVCAVNARAVLEALLGWRSPFVRTPKFGARGDCDPDHKPSRFRLRFPSGLVELLMGGFWWRVSRLAFLRPYTLIGAPFLLLFALGYAGVGLQRLLDQYARRPTPIRFGAAPWLWSLLSRCAVGTVGVLLLAGVAVTTIGAATPVGERNRELDRAWRVAATACGISSPNPFRWGTREPVALAVDLTTANWQPLRPAQGKSSAIQRIQVERGSLVLGIQLDEQANQGEIMLDLAEAMPALGDSLGTGRLLAFKLEYSPRFTGEFQAFVKDRHGHLEYGSMQIVESHDVARPVTVVLIPSLRMPAMGYQDKGFDPAAGISQLGLKISVCRATA